MVTLYLAHQMADRNSAADTKALAAIAARFPDATVLASSQCPPEDAELHFQEVKASDIVVFAPGLNGTIGKLVHDEIQLAQGLKKPV